MPESINLTNFSELGLSKHILKAIADQGYETPTPIQEQAIPLVLKRHDLMGLAQTGTGKTAAFGLPLIHHLLEDNIKAKPKTARALILAPTRELVTQIADNIRHYVKQTPLWISLVIGGQSIKSQSNHLARGTDILVATPGRLLDLVGRGAVRLDDVKYLILDEADQMLDLGFIHALKEISTLVGKPRQTLLFSATMPRQVAELSKAYLDDPIRVEVAAPGKAVDKITQSVHHVASRAKTELLKQCLNERENDLSLVFHRTKHGAEKLKNHLEDCGFTVNSIHGNKSQGQRDRAIKDLKTGKIRILVATDVAARGIDIPGISHVYNYNLPEVPENYVHRIGRTARAGESGEAIAFCSPDEMTYLRGIERLMAMRIPVASGEEPEGNHEKPKKTRGNSRRKPAGNGQGQRRDRNGSRDDAPRRENTRNERPRREKTNRNDSGDSFVAKITRDQSDALAGDKPNRNKRPNSNADSQAQHKPKRFKNKQMSVTDYDNREQGRKDNRDNASAKPAGTRKFEGNSPARNEGSQAPRKPRNFKTKSNNNPGFAKKTGSRSKSKEYSS